MWLSTAEIAFCNHLADSEISRTRLEEQGGAYINAVICTMVATVVTRVEMRNPIPKFNVAADEMIDEMLGGSRRCCWGVSTMP